MAVKVAIVTDASSGIGLSIVKGLCAKFDGFVYLTAREYAEGKIAIECLKDLGYNPLFHQLDVGNKESVICFRDFIKKTHGGIDVLVNNAAIIEFPDDYPSYEQCKAVLDVNYYGVLTVEEFLYPLLRENARVVNISSNCGHLSNIRNEYWLRVLASKDLTLEELNEFVEWYLDSVKNGRFNKEDFANEGKHAEYRVSKVALSALTSIQQRKYLDKNISINSVHSGVNRTDMKVGKCAFDHDEVASAPLYLIFEAPQSLKGTFMWSDKKLVDWYDTEGDYFCKNVC